jgi:hypothetical protein
MKIQIRKQTTLSGQVVRVGEVHEASPSDGNFLIGIGFAILAPELAPEAAPKAQPEEPKPKPKRRRKSGNDHEESGDQNHGSQPAAE